MKKIILFILLFIAGIILIAEPEVVIAKVILGKIVCLLYVILFCKANNYFNK